MERIQATPRPCHHHRFPISLVRRPPPPGTPPSLEQISQSQTTLMNWRCLRVPPQLSASASTAGADLQPQSRFITAPNEVLSKHGAFSILAGSGYGRDARRQLSAKLVASQPSTTTSPSADRS